MSWVLDLDGVVWLGDQPIAGAAEAVERLRGAGQRVLFATNNSSPLLSELEAKLHRFDIPAQGDVLTSASAAASLLSPGTSALVLGGPGVLEALEVRGVRVLVTGNTADAVVVGFTQQLDYEWLRRVSTAVMEGARLIGTNDDPTYPTANGPIPGGGAILAAVATATGVVPEVAGKPYPAMVALTRQVLGRVDDAHTMVGDRPSTDGRFARALGARFALVLSGVTTAEHLSPEHLSVDPRPDLVASDLASLVEGELKRPSSRTHPQ